MAELLTVSRVAPPKWWDPKEGKDRGTWSYGFKFQERGDTYFNIYKYYPEADKERGRNDYAWVKADMKVEVEFDDQRANKITHMVSTSGAEFEGATEETPTEKNLDPTTSSIITQVAIKVAGDILRLAENVEPKERLAFFHDRLREVRYIVTQLKAIIISVAELANLPALRGQALQYIKELENLYEEEAPEPTPEPEPEPEEKLFTEGAPF